MKITFLKQHGQLVPYSAEGKAKLDKMADGAAYIVDIKNMDIRTLAQNKALPNLPRLRKKRVAKLAVPLAGLKTHILKKQRKALYIAPIQGKKWQIKIQNG